MAKPAQEGQSQHQSANPRNLDAPYGDAYRAWKSWDDDEFGKLTKTDSAYFTAEIRRTNCKFPQNSKVLEIGFGNGAFLKYANERKWDVLGTEINEALVKTAQACGFSAVYTDNLSAFKDDSFDLVVAFDVLEHIPQAELPDMILEIKRILKSDRFFIARFPNGDSPFGLVYQNGDVTHVTTIGSGKLRYFAARTNMKVVFAGGAAEPILGSNFHHFLHRMVALPIKKTINLFSNLVFFPGANVAFCSSNLTMICQKIRPTEPRR
ncbi:class I SAM-dependent methyltransferase [Bradyrhizobium sp.]|uniref:class I SAM-dependent methyltransferase n=1 Tax=Bradyrhizobium sp. TaxID=376 RepID=UPI0025C2EBA6|nr:class I SAM-dependent methyltransferase [Bradyrhizobium sp.]